MTRSRSMFFGGTGSGGARVDGKGLRPRDNVVACADKGSPMTVPVKILSVLTGLSLAGSVQARIWTNDRGATVVAVLVAVRDAEVDLKLQDGRIVAVPKNVFFRRRPGVYPGMGEVRRHASRYGCGGGEPSRAGCVRRTLRSPGAELGRSVAGEGGRARLSAGEGRAGDG